MNKSIVSAVALLGASVVFAVEGPTRVCPTLPFIDAGWVVHLDAQDVTSMQMDDDGYVKEWVSDKSPVPGETLVFSNFNFDGSERYGYSPYYDATLIGGRGAIVFGKDKTGTTHNTVLASVLPTGSVFTNKYVFIVASSSSAAGSYDAVYGIANKDNSQWLGYWGEAGNPGYGWAPTKFFLKGAIGRGWVEGALMYDRKNATGDCVMPHTRDDLHLFSFEIYSTWQTKARNANNFGPSIGHVRYNSDYRWMGPVCEVLIYDCVMTDAERKYTEALLWAKWFGNKVCVWKGGSSGNWSDAANWEGGVPGNGDAAVVDATVALTVDADVQVGAFAVNPAKGGSLTSAGHDFVVTDQFGVPDDYALSFSGSVCFRMGGDTQRVTLPADTTVTGTLTIDGGQLVRFVAPVKGQGTIVEQNGDFDLNGTAQAVAGLDGYLVTNSAETAASVTRVGAADGSLIGGLSGKIAVADAATGTTRLAGDFGADVSLTASSGVVRVETNLPPYALKGRTLHLDASRLDTMTTNEQGCVTSWRSFARRFRRPTHKDTDVPSDIGKNILFTNTLAGTYTPAAAKKALIEYPIYVESLYNGKPAVKFGMSVTNADEKVYSYLCSQDPCVVKMRTFFIVHSKITKPGPMNSYDRIFAASDSNYGINYNGTAWWKDNSGKTFWINGVCKYKDGVLTNGYSSVGFKADEATLSVGDFGSLREIKQPSFSLYVTQTDHFGFCGAVMEFIGYDRELTDAERQGVEAYLMDKWGIARDAKADEPSFKGPLAPTAELTLGKGAELDLATAEQKVAKVTVEGPAAVTQGSFAFDAMEVKVGETMPKLTVDGNVDVTGTALSFTGGKPATGVFLTTTGLLTGPFAEVTGTEKDIRYTANSARFPSGLLLFLK